MLLNLVDQLQLSSVNVNLYLFLKVSECAGARFWLSAMVEN